MLEAKYNYLEIEKKKYENWKNAGYFKSGDKKKQPFTIVIPPPNVTGKLHLGHAWDTTLQDIIIRYKRMDGYDALWLPGMDHAGIATQAKVDAKLKAEGIKPREMDRDEWLKEAWSWKEEYSNNIRTQWGKLGLSLDYSKERFTLDEGLSEAVKYVFVTLYEKGYIYRGERIINWDPEAMTALSNEEVIYKDDEGFEHYFKYYFEDNKSEYLTIMTTRPETIFGDGAIAVHPKDERYKDLVGRKVITPIANNIIPIIADEYVDMEKGSGCVKITPAHDPNDFEVGLRHNIRKDIIMDPNGTMSNCDLVPLAYQGLDRYSARKKFVEDAKDNDLLLKIDKIIHSVGHSERTDAVIEPYLSKQWFVKMDVLAKQVLENQANSDTKVNFVPKRFEKILIHWMEDCHDWCISRQLWWGHQIPAWYRNDEIYVGYNAPEGEGWIQDSDVLDTWFSSALWPFSTFGWPNDTEDFNRYFPNDVLVTGYDIIFFWVARMIFQSLEFTKVRPFKECLIHGLVRDHKGRKMSKSLGNGVDPMDVIDEFGADSLRYFLATSSAPGMDLRFDTEKVKATWNFNNKLWNASRFVLMNLEDFKTEDYNLKDNLKDHDKWIITKTNETIRDVRKFMDKYEFNNVGTILYTFIWESFCDSYIEMAKSTINEFSTKSTLVYVLTNIIKMLHPFMPYITDEIYDMLPIKTAENIMISDYPKYDKFNVYAEESKKVENVIAFVKQYRNIIAENNITKEANVRINNTEDYSLIKFLLKLDDKIIDNELDITSYIVENGIYRVTIYYQKQITEEDIKLREKQIEILTASINKRENLLNNENYIKKAPANLVESEKQKLAEEKKQLETLKE